jgi:hypothetical protein
MCLVCLCQEIKYFHSFAITANSISVFYRIFRAMKKMQIPFIALALGLSSCTSVFWVNNVAIPADKELTTREIQLEIFDAVGQRCKSMDVEITTTNRGESAVITEFKVPKFSSENRQPTKVNYLWMVDGQDTVVYELVYQRKLDWAVFSTVGAGVMLASIPAGIIAEDFWVFLGTLYVGAATSIYGGLLIDLPTGIISLLADSRAREDGFQRSWKLKGVRNLSPVDYPPVLVRGIESLGDEPEPTAEPKGRLNGRITQP